ncbi:hypothetical protein NL676_011613 [Syzygium grande]|nr:hypothetical protein NL676_011613 [Syzygium grande]
MGPSEFLHLLSLDRTAVLQQNLHFLGSLFLIWQRKYGSPKLVCVAAAPLLARPISADATELVRPTPLAAPAVRRTAAASTPPLLLLPLFSSAEPSRPCPAQPTAVSDAARLRRAAGRLVRPRPIAVPCRPATAAAPPSRAAQLGLGRTWPRSAREPSVARRRRRSASQLVRRRLVRVVAADSPLSLTRPSLSDLSPADPFAAPLLSLVGSAASGHFRPGRLFEPKLVSDFLSPT